MHWDVGPAEAVGVLAAGWLVILRLKDKVNGGSQKERLVRLETKVDLILSAMQLKVKG